jgi:Protein of unknown function (DUF2958)
LNDGTKKLITDAERAQLLANGAMRAQGQAIDPVPVVRLFTPDAHAYAYMTIRQSCRSQDARTSFRGSF